MTIYDYTICECIIHPNRMRAVMLYRYSSHRTVGNFSNFSSICFADRKDILEMRGKDADGTETGQSASSNHSKRSGYDRFAFDRRNLSNMMLLGKLQ